MRITVLLLFCTVLLQTVWAGPVRVQSSEQLLQALKELKGTPAQIRLAPGTYTLNRKLEFRNLSGLALEGEPGCVMVFDVPSDNMMGGRSLLNFSSCSNISVTGIHFRFKNCAYTFTSALGLKKTSSFSLRNCQLENTDQRIKTALQADSSTELMLTDTVVKGFSLNAFYLRNCNAVLIQGCRVTDTTEPVRQVDSSLTLADNDFGAASVPDRQAALEEAMQLLKAGQNKAAVEKLKWLTLNFPRDAVSWYLLGTACRRHNLFHQAREAFTQYLSCGGTNYIGYYELGETWLDEEDYGQAAQHFQKSLSAKPGFTLSQTALRMTLEASNKNPHYVVYDIIVSGSLTLDGRKYPVSKVWTSGVQYNSRIGHTKDNGTSKLMVEVYFEGLEDGLAFFLRRTPQGWVPMARESGNQPRDVVYTYGVVRSGLDSVGNILYFKQTLAEPEWDIAFRILPDQDNLLQKIELSCRPLQAGLPGLPQQVVLTMQFRESGYLYHSLRTPLSLEQLRRTDFSERITTVPASLLQHLGRDYARYIPDLAAYLTQGIQDEVLKVKVLHDWVAYHYEYVYEGAFDFQKAFQNQSGVCQTYAMSVWYLCRAAGLDVGYVAGVGHGFNALVINGQLYFLDPTWDGRQKNRLSSRWLFLSYQDFIRDNEGEEIPAHIPHQAELRIGNKKPVMQAGR